MKCLGPYSTTCRHQKKPKYRANRISNAWLPIQPHAYIRKKPKYRANRISNAWVPIQPHADIRKKKKPKYKASRIWNAWVPIQPHADIRKNQSTGLTVYQMLGSLFNHMRTSGKKNQSTGLTVYQMLGSLFNHMHTSEKAKVQGWPFVKCLGLYSTTCIHQKEKKDLNMNRIWSESGNTCS